MRRTIDRRTLVAASALAATIATHARAQDASPEPIPGPATLASGLTGFALDLYRELRADAGSGNLIVSPYSVALALAMTSAGARGDTATQMASTLGFTVPADTLHETFAALTADLLDRGNQEADDDRGIGESGLRIANALFGEQTFPFDQAFIDQLDAEYGAGIELEDFKNDPETARNDINAWVEEGTEGRIKDIVPEGAITELTRLVLANAIWFYGAWLNAFDEDDTADAPFHPLDGDPVDVPFMRQVESFAYAALDGMQVVDLPYAAPGFGMTIILPDEGKLDAVEASLDPGTLQDAIDALAWTRIHLYLPKWEFDYAASLADTLKALGMTDAFDAERADFSGMIAADAAPPDDSLAISDVLHKAFIAVDENGTEAAAATVVIMVGAGAPPEEEPLELRIDRPFLFAIRDDRTGAILFLGRVTTLS